MAIRAEPKYGWAVRQDEQGLCIRSKENQGKVVRGETVKTQASLLLSNFEFSILYCYLVIYNKRKAMEKLRIIRM